MKIQAKIDRVLQSGKLKAIASVSLDGMFVVKGLKVMDGQKGLFVSMPQEVFAGKNGNKQYSNLFFPVTNSAKEELQTAVLEVYRQYMDPTDRKQPKAGEITSIRSMIATSGSKYGKPNPGSLTT